jgi:hypothetical protein
VSAAQASGGPAIGKETARIAACLPSLDRAPAVAEPERARAAVVLRPALALLPLRDDVRAPDVTGEPNAPSIPAVYRLLLAEDDEGIREPLARALEREGYAVDEVTDGGEGRPPR